MSKLKKRGVGHKAILALLSGVKETENSGIDVKIVKPYPLRSRSRPASDMGNSIFSKFKFLFLHHSG